MPLRNKVDWSRQHLWSSKVWIQEACPRFITKQIFFLYLVKLCWLCLLGETRKTNCLLQMNFSASVSQLHGAHLEKTVHRGISLALFCSLYTHLSISSVAVIEESHFPVLWGTRRSHMRKPGVATRSSLRHTKADECPPWRLTSRRRF